MKDIILKAQELYFSYDDENTHSLNGLSLEIQRGKKVAFMGANGSGKSTFFLCCNGIHRPSSGTLFVDGKPIDYSKKGLLDLRQKVGIVFQDPDNQLFSASVYQEISFGILNLGISEDGGLAVQGGQSGGHRIMAEDKGIRDVHVRRGVDKAACLAPVRGGLGTVQVAFCFDAAEALLLDLCGAHVPANRFHGISC